MFLQFTAKKRARMSLITLFALTCLLMSAACKWSNVGGPNDNRTNANASDAAVTSLTPPFSTKEPERYQATMITTGGLNDQTQPDAGAANQASQQTFIARDGERRRTDYELTQGVKITLLQLPTGDLLLWPAKKIYAELKQDASDNTPNPANIGGADFSPDRLINESQAGAARYEKLGAEELNGRKTTKYRVETRGQTGAAKTVITETFIWVDETLGMPVKSETTMTGEATRGAKYTMELRDIKQDIDTALFELPKDYRKVAAREISGRILSSTH